MSLIRGSSKKDLDPCQSKPKVKSVRFNISFDLRNLFIDFVHEKDRHLYEEFICKIRDLGQEIKDHELLQLIQEARGCISILDKNFTLFVQVVLLLKWCHRSPEVVSEFQGFLVDLCSAHNYYTKMVMDHLITAFRFGGESCQWVDGLPDQDDIKHFTNLHSVIKSILQIIPMSRDLLITSLNNCTPYIKKPAQEHASFVCNVLQITNYEPTLRLDVLKIVTHKLVAHDVAIQRTELEQILDDSEMFHMELPAGDTLVNECSVIKSKVESLDLCMKVVFGFIKSQCYSKDKKLIWDKVKLFYADLVKVFESIVLPTHATNHVQFILFYLVSFKPVLAVGLLQFLWAKVSNPSIAPVIRQSSVSYIASFITRAASVSHELVLDVLAEMSSWVHSYINSQDSVSVVLQDTRLHGVFYATCQAIFYIIAFRHKELVNSDKGLLLLSGLNLPKIVSSRLNPLRACQPVIAKNFASVARAYQLAYCYTIIERNSRAKLPQLYRDSSGREAIVDPHLETFFPFDPYMLPSSESFIGSIYREYDGGNPSPTETKEVVAELGATEAKTDLPMDDVDDDFIESCKPIACSIKSTSFSYSTSPGFLHHL